jgi:hypothetical protein
MLCDAFGRLIEKHALCLLGVDTLNLGVVFEVRFYQMVNQGTFLGQVRGPTEDTQGMPSLAFGVPRRCLQAKFGGNAEHGDDEENQFFEHWVFKHLMELVDAFSNRGLAVHALCDTSISRLERATLRDLKL